MTNTTTHPHLELLFQVELQYREGLTAITSPEGRMGQYLGSGEGTIKGHRLQGAVRWDLYEVVGETRCQTNFAGLIETNTGAKIQFEATGFGIVPDRSKPQRWHIANAVQFDTEDQRYDWLNTMLALWDGEFDMETYRHSYQVYTRAGERS
jgi:hypothetical protein